MYSELCKKFHIRALFIAAVNDKYVHIMSTHIATSFFWRGFFHSLHIHENKKITLCVFSCCWPVIKMDVAKPDYLDAKFKSSIYKICLPYMFNAALIIFRVYFSSILCPMPYGPPVQPVLISHTFTFSFLSSINLIRKE